MNTLTACLLAILLASLLLLIAHKLERIAKAIDRSTDLITSSLKSGLLRGPAGPEGLPGRQGPKGEKGEPEVIPHPVLSPGGHRTDLAEVLKQGTDSQWHHDAWVQNGSTAYEHAMNAPGVAVKRFGQSIDLGKQG